MDFLALSALCLVIVSVTAQERPGVCPEPTSMSGSCVFDSEVNCIEDFECPALHKCCLEGCNKVCKSVNNLSAPSGFMHSTWTRIAYLLGIGAKSLRPGQCPAPSGLVSTCIFIPGVHCFFEHECPEGKKCCEEGCGRECMDPV